MLFWLDIGSNTSCGLDALNEIKMANPDVMILLMTAYDIEHPSAKQAMSEGFTVLFKPFKMDTLLHALNQVSVT
jgi:DNA-binding NtrC family response regulator